MTNQDLRMTAQRKVILEELRSVDTHPTADRIYEMVRRRLPRVSLATVYRNLEWLAEAGVIQKYESAGSQRRFDGNPSTHDHIRCVECGRLDDIMADPIPDVEERIRDKTDYRIVGYRLEYLGICPSCRASSAQGTGGGASD
ncbi:MAG: transcriptional repressor [Phycisphaerae bacterium]|nr:transcriptional repressor [Phycisphaerae bacterium]